MREPALLETRLPGEHANAVRLPLQSRAHKGAVVAIGSRSSPVTRGWRGGLSFPQWHALSRAVPALLILVSGCAGGSGGGFSTGSATEDWTIRCIEIHGDGARETAEGLASILADTPGVTRDRIEVTHGLDGVSRIYHGRYRVRHDPQTGRRSFPPELGNDLTLVKNLHDALGRRLFIFAMRVRRPPPDVGKPEWVLVRAPGVYTLQVASFVPAEGFTDYKQAAAEYCAALRSEGHESYFLHGEQCSIVTVGSFGADALMEKEIALRGGGGRVTGRTYQTDYSPEVLALQQNELFRYNYVNGARVHARFGSERTGAQPSQLVRIPRPGERY